MMTTPFTTQDHTITRHHTGGGKAPTVVESTDIVVDDEVVFAETDELATAALPEGHTYELGGTTRLVLPDGAEATLTLADGTKVELEGPMDLRLR